MAVSEHRTILSLGCGTRPERELLASLQRSVEGQSGWLFRVEIEGVWASFEEPLGALRATAEILHANPEFRAGLHYGETTLTADGDLLGNTLSVAKRLEHAAEPGRAYLSFALYDLVSRETLHFAEFESPIAVQLKGLGENLAVPMAECIHDCERAFKFLDSYGAEDSALFFGRKGEVREIEQILHSNPWVVLFGQSGVGKSSVLGAGVLPLLSARDYSLHTFRCLEEPLELLRESFGEDIVAGLSSSPRRVLLFDQFEEFFLRVEAGARKEFWRFFDSALKNQALSELLWVFSIREDFLAEMGEAEDVVDGMLDHRLRLLPLSREAAKECILGPAERCGRWVEPSLVENILNDLFDQGIDPPELQIVLDRLDAGREPNSPWLTLESYRQVGGFTEILVDYLYEVLEQTESPSAAKKVLLALVSEAGTKKAGTPQDLCERSKLPISRVEPILEALVRARLVRRLSEGAIYELSHEYLIEEIQAWADEADLAARYAGFALEAEVESWNRLGSLMDRSRLRLLNSQRARLQPTDTQRELLLRASVVHGSDPSFWKGDFDTAPLFLRLLDEVEDPVVQRRLIEELHPLTLSDPAWQRVLQAMLVYGNPELLNKLSAGERTVQLKRQMERRFLGRLR